MRRRESGTTLIELIVASGVLLVMVLMTSNAVVSYVKAYHQYTDRGLRVRQAAKILEVVAQHLRSAESLQGPDFDQLEHGISLAEKPLVFRERAAGLRALFLTERGVLELQELDEQQHKKGSTAVGKTRGLTVREEVQGRERHLHLALEVEGGLPMETDVPLRGVSQ